MQIAQSFAQIESRNRSSQRLGPQPYADVAQWHAVCGWRGLGEEGLAEGDLARNSAAGTRFGGVHADTE